MSSNTVHGFWDVETAYLNATEISASPEPVIEDHSNSKENSLFWTNVDLYEPVEDIRTPYQSPDM